MGKMKIWKMLLLLLPLCAGPWAHGQKGDGIHQGMLRVQGTLALGIDTRRVTGEQRYYIYGEGEYLLSDHIGMNGSIWANVGSSTLRFVGLGQPEEEAFIHSILAGPVFHLWSDRPLDLFAGIQPGFSLTQERTTFFTHGVRLENQFGPTASVFGGAAYYGSFFHLFVQARYVRAQHISYYVLHPMNDLRLCIGLGFNIN
jgi:hypothetical protein